MKVYLLGELIVIHLSPRHFYLLLGTASRPARFGSDQCLEVAVRRWVGHGDLTSINPFLIYTNGT